MINKPIINLSIITNLLVTLSISNLYRLYFQSKNKLSDDDTENVILSISEMISTSSPANHASVVFLVISMSFFTIILETIYFIIKNSTSTIDIACFAISILTIMFQGNVIAITTHENRTYHSDISMVYFLFSFIYMIMTVIDACNQYLKQDSESIFKNKKFLTISIIVTCILCVLYFGAFVLYIVKNPVRLTLSTLLHGKYLPQYELTAISITGCSFMFNTIKAYYYKNIQFVN